MGRVYSGAPISPSAPLVSTDTKEAGLWLWQGKVPPSSSPQRPKSRDQQILGRMVPAARRAGWIALPAGLALTFIAISMMPRPDRPVSADMPAGTRSSSPSPTVVRPIGPVAPTERTEAQPDQVQMPSAPQAAELTAQAPAPPVVKARSQGKLSRTARKTHASRAHQRPLSFRPGVLTPPPMMSQGGSY